MLRTGKQTSTLSSRETSDTFCSSVQYWTRGGLLPARSNNNGTTIVHLASAAHSQAQFECAGTQKLSFRERERDRLCLLIHSLGPQSPVLLFSGWTGTAPSARLWVLLTVCGRSLLCAPFGRAAVAPKTHTSSGQWTVERVDRVEKVERVDTGRVHRRKSVA